MSTRSVTSIQFTDAKDLRRIKRAAKKANQTLSAFLVEAALKEALVREGKCPACGHTTGGRS